MVVLARGGGDVGRRGLTEQGNRGALTFMGVACIFHANSKSEARTTAIGVLNLVTVPVSEVSVFPLFLI